MHMNVHCVRLLNAKCKYWRGLSFKTGDLSVVFANQWVGKVWLDIFLNELYIWPVCKNIWGIIILPFSCLCMFFVPVMAGPFIPSVSSVSVELLSVSDSRKT